ncbi:MAG TPA: hypothetical protein VFM70_07775 [Salinimicrobium sp.]|nr:hypothetical protein [Salinimicrobium sp.]
MEATTTQAAPTADYNVQHNNTPIPTSEWFWTLLITAIPIVGLIMLFVWGFGSSTNTNKSNWAKATLLWMLVITVLYLLLFLVIGISALGMSESSY